MELHFFFELVVTFVSVCLFPTMTHDVLRDATCADTVNISITRCSSSRSHPHPSLPLRVLPSFFLFPFSFQFFFSTLFIAACMLASAKLPQTSPASVLLLYFVWCWQGVVQDSCLLPCAAVPSVALLCLRAILPAHSFNCFPPRLRRISNCFLSPIVFHLQLFLSSPIVDLIGPVSPHPETFLPPPPLPSPPSRRT